MTTGNINAQERQRIRTEQRSLRVFLPCIVEELVEDPEYKHRVRVALKNMPASGESEGGISDGALLDNQGKGIPIASQLAGEGYGELYPIEPGFTEGWLFFSDVPIQDILTGPGFIESSNHRYHDLNDAVFMPRTFSDVDELPTPDGVDEYDPGSYLFMHPSGTYTFIDSEANGGTYEVFHHFGHRLKLHEGEGVTLEHADGYGLYLADDLVVLGFPSGLRLVVDAVTGEIRTEGTHHVTEDLIVDGEFNISDLSAETVEATLLSAAELGALPQAASSTADPTTEAPAGMVPFTAADGTTYHLPFYTP